MANSANNKSQNANRDLAAAAAEVAANTLDTMGEKVRVHALAKALGVTSAEMVTVLGEHGFENKRASSTLSKQDVERVLAELAAPAESDTEQDAAQPDADPAPASPTRSRRRRRRGATRKAGAPTQHAEPAEQAVATTPEPEPAPEPEPEPVPESAREEPEQDAEQPSERPAVRRRIVRRVGSRTAADGAEELRREKEEKDGKDNGRDNDRDRDGGGSGSSRRRRGSRGRGRGRSRSNETSHQNDSTPQTEPTPPVVSGTAASKKAAHEDTDQGTPVVDEPVKLKGSTRLESKRRWREAQGNEKRRSVSRAEFIARRENIYRSMVVRDSQRSDHPGRVTQVGVVEDGLLAEHFVTSETQTSTIGNIYLGRVQNVLASMEAAFIDIGTGRNAVLYASEVDWRSEHIRGRSRRIESALKQGDQVLVQVIKDPLGHKGARLTNRVSFAGRYLVYVPGGKTQGISRKLPESERKRLKGILQRVVPDGGGTIIRTAAEGVSEEKIAEDVDRLHRRWVDITEREERERDSKGAKPVTMYEEPNLLVKIIRDMFNEDFNELVVDGRASAETVLNYIQDMAPDLENKVVTWKRGEHDGQDAFAAYELDDQLTAALSRKVWLPSGGYLIIDKTEAMTVIDVNTGSFVGSGGNLEETVTKNNLEAAEEIVRQMRLRDMGGMIVVDFIDMVLEENRDLVLRKLDEFLVSDRTKHKVSEVTSLGLVQMTRKRLGVGLVETYSTECETCGGRGLVIHTDPVEHDDEDTDDNRDHKDRSDKGGKRKGHGAKGGRQDHHDKADRDGLKQARHEQEIRRRYEQMMEESATAEVAKTVHAASQDHGDAAESTESGDSADSEQRTEAPEAAGKSSRPRRVRRRVVRRGRPQDAASGREPDESVEPEASDGSDVSAIAAEAVVHAGEIDPEEPTGADYVADEDDDQPGAVEPTDTQETGEPSAGTKTTARRDRRGRRVVRRVAETPEPAAEVEPETVPEPEPVDEPAKDEPEDALSQYEQARQEFDQSPRRRRKVRGNSRSDIAPKPEDFGLDPDTEIAAADDDTAATADTASEPAPQKKRSGPPQNAEVTESTDAAEPEASTQQTETRAEKQPQGRGQRRGGRRNRRKVVRTSSH